MFTDGSQWALPLSTHSLSETLPHWAWTVPETHCNRSGTVPGLGLSQEVLVASTSAPPGSPEQPCLHCPAQSAAEFSTSNCSLDTSFPMPAFALVDMYMSGKDKKPCCGLQMPWLRDSLSPVHWSVPLFGILEVLHGWAACSSAKTVEDLKRAVEAPTGEPSGRDGSLRTDFRWKVISLRLPHLNTSPGLPVSVCVCLFADRGLWGSLAFQGSWALLPRTPGSSDFSTAGYLFSHSCPSAGPKSV